MSAKTVREAIETPITEKIWQVIRNVTGHNDCPLCDLPKKVEDLVTNLIDKNLSFEETAQIINIPENKIKEHIKAILEVTAAELYSRIALLKIIASIDKNPELLAKVKAGDIVKAVTALTAFEIGKGSKNKTIISIPAQLAKMDSFSLLQGREALIKG